MADATASRPFYMTKRFWAAVGTVLGFLLGIAQYAQNNVEPASQPIPAVQTK